MRASASNRERYGEDFYKRIGATGGKASGTGGFYANRELARAAGKLGGQASKLAMSEEHKRKIGESNRRRAGEKRKRKAE